MTDPNNGQQDQGEALTATLRQLIAGGGDGLIQAARLLAEIAHDGQVDKAGHPYLGHPERVARRVAEAGGGPEAVAVAWLHDTVEDTWVMREFLTLARFPEAVVNAVDVVTKRTGEPTSNYACRIAGDRLAVVVKQADLADNTNPERFSLLDPTIRARLEAKYAAFATALNTAISQSSSIEGKLL